MDIKTTKVYTNALKIIHLEIPKVLFELTEKPTEVELWLWLLKFGPKLSYAERVKINHNPLFNELLDLLVLDKFNDKELDQYRQSMLDEKHFKNFADYARLEGREEGIVIGEAKGEARGELKAKQELAKKLFAKGMSSEEVSELTGLAIDELLLEN